MLKHPKGLYVLFFTEMWERFSFYGMKALLIFYLTKYHFFSDNHGSEIVGNYAALVYALPVLGGYLADKFLGFRKAVSFGAILLIFGHFGMAFEGHQAYFENGEIIRDEQALSVFYFSLGLLIMGVGFLKPNISTMVGRLYKDNDPKRDGGFTIFYMGINLGAAAATILCVLMAEKYGWRYGFGLAGIGMVFGLIVFILGRPLLKGVGEPSDPDKLKKKILNILPTEYGIYLFGFLLVFVFWIIVQYHNVVGGLLIGTVGAVLIYLSWYMAVKCDKESRGRIIVLLVLNLYAVIYFAYLEQQFISMNLFADRLVNRNIFGITVSAGQFLSLNSIYIILFAPVFAWLWVKLNKRKLEPNVPAKFGLGVIQAAIGFGCLFIGMKIAGPETKVHVIWLFLFYLFITTGELSLSPVGLSSVTKLSPKTIVGFMMGVWFLASAASEYLAAVISKLASVETVGGEMVDASAAYSQYLNLFNVMFYFGIGCGILLIIVSPLLKKLMYGVK